MKNSKFITLTSAILAVVLLFIGCVNNNEGAAKRIVSDFAKAVNSGDFNAIVATFTPDLATSLKTLITDEKTALDELIKYVPSISDLLPTSSVKKSITVNVNDITVITENEIYVNCNILSKTEGDNTEINSVYNFILIEIDENWYIDSIEYIS